MTAPVIPSARASNVVSELIDLLIRRAVECIDQHRIDLALTLLEEARMVQAMRRSVDLPDQHEAGQVTQHAATRYSAFTAHLTDQQRHDLHHIHEQAQARKLAYLHGKD